MITHVQVHMHVAMQKNIHTYICCFICQLFIPLIYLLARAYPFFRCQFGLTQNSTIHSAYSEHSSFKYSGFKFLNSPREERHMNNCSFDR